MTDRSGRQQLGSGTYRHCEHCGNQYYQRTEPSEDEVSTMQAAEILTVSFSRVHQLVSLGKLGTVRRDGRLRFLKRAAVEAWQPDPAWKRRTFYAGYPARPKK